MKDPRHPEGLRRVAIDPISRVEGHGKVTLLIDDDNRVQQARLHIVEFRGFERFIQGRPYWELPLVVQRLCGICPVSHHLAAGKAIDMLVGAPRLTPSADKLRRLLHFGQTLQSHALHFFYLASPDLLFGFSAEIPRRSAIALLQATPDVVLKGVKLRKFGQELIGILTGKRIHGSLVVPGGVNRSLGGDEVRYLRGALAPVLGWAHEAVALARELYRADLERHRQFARVASPLLSLVDAGGALELYQGGLRARRVDGRLLFDHRDPCDYGELILEEVKSWSYMKFPYLKALGPREGWYRVGPLARLLNCDRIPTLQAEQARTELLAQVDPDAQDVLLYHWARMIELLHCAEAIDGLLADPDLQGRDLVQPPGQRTPECFGVLEAPRGTLIHHYRVDDDDLVSRANLIVSTTSNNQAMNAAIQDVARRYLDGRELTEALLNQVEVAIRAFDPCLSCATHALGRMPLQLALIDGAGGQVDQLWRDGDGDVRRSG